MTDIFANMTDADTKQKLEPEKAIVVYGVQCAVIWATPFMAQDIRETGADVRDILGDPPEPGFWLWEGDVREVVYEATPDHATEYDVSYVGEFRRLSSHEWECIRMGSPPFDITDPKDLSPLSKLMAGLVQRCVGSAQINWLLDAPAATKLQVVWQEVVGDELLACWNTTHQGAGCIPPVRMYHAPLHPRVEMWVFQNSGGTFEFTARLRFQNWWQAYRPRVHDMDLHSLAEAQACAKERLERALSDIRNRAKNQSGSEGLDPIFRNPVHLI